MKKRRGLARLKGLLAGRYRVVDRDWHGVDEDDLLEAIRNNVNANDHALYNLLAAHRTLARLCDRAGVDVRGKSILEIGTSRLPGLPLVLMMKGCREYYATNVLEVDDFVSESYARILQLVMCGCLPIEPDALEALLRWQRRDGETVGVLDPGRFRNLSPRPAEEIDLPAESVDLIFSSSVLEHLARPADVLANAFRMLRPGGVMISIIDLRDHRDFSRPLEFLRLSAEEYGDRATAYGNRLRSAEYRALIEAAGFREEWVAFMDEPPALLRGGSTDQAEHLLRATEAFWPKRSMNEVEPWVDEAMRGGLHPDYQKHSLEDLSVVGICCIHRKPAG